MFDSRVFATLSTGVVDEFARALSRTLGTPSDLRDAERVDTIRALEELVCVATAAQALLSAELDESRRASEAERGVPVMRRGRGVASEVALARRESPHAGQRHLGLATIVRRELPCTWAAWRAGRITEWKATVIARETACLTREHRAAVDREVAADAAKVERMGVRELAAACRRRAYGLDPESDVAKRRRAEKDRTVTLRPAPDAMTWLTALLPVQDGVAAYAGLTRTADSARAAGDPRSRGQVMADTLVSSVLDDVSRRDDAQTRWHLPEEAPHDDAARPAGVLVELVMTDQALFGTSDEPANVPGYGPIPAELAREIVTGACSRDEQVWLRRLYTSPTTGQLVALDSRARRFRGGLARFIRLRDQVCRTPWCDAPIRHVDHAHDVAEGGETRADNAQGLCEACNYAKQAAGWTARGSPPGAVRHQVETTTPTGHTCHTSPPAVRAPRAQRVRIDFVLAF
ncbi:DUF222 domain-containing protein [Nocardioides agariphilus]|uniref:DUF222 domain-containing protein n=1 Tax=Nocardioides agariphilus TaxID=433664 RepID=A0A930VGP2_9ACTN|nr:DUF222 domain-containing protein [Nocardioides agariphilus]MBF4767209.1 DUF222 domain-containing protein [Nocardioides agariphilus]